MYKLSRVWVLVLALVLTISMVDTSFAARKRKTATVEKETPAVEEKVSKEQPKEETKAKSTEVKANEEVVFDFEKDGEYWEIPDWAFEKEDHVAEQLNWTKKYASNGKGALEIVANFPGRKWTGAYIEYVEYLDWSDYSEVTVDIYVPEDAPLGLMGKIILTVGEDWRWVEMRKPERLDPGKWTTIRGNLMPGSTDWRREQPTDEFRMDVRKLGVRVESDKKAIYKGPFYIDSIRLTKIGK